MRNEKKMAKETQRQDNRNIQMASKSKRWALSIAPAALVTVSLFLFMDRVISTDEVRFEETQPRVLEEITPQHVDTDPRPDKRQPPQKPVDALKPPPPPRITITRANVGLPAATIQGAAPTEMGFGRIQPIAFDPVAISDRDAQPVMPPLPQYPDDALRRGMEGNCDVRFDVDVRGRPLNITATCSDRVFVRAAERAVSKVEFAPKIIRGTPAERRNVVYPLVFQIRSE